MQIQLPEASGEATHEHKGVDILIDARGRYTIGERQPVTGQMDTLKKALKDAVGDKPDPLIIIDADRNATHQSVMTVLDAAAQLGYKHVTFAARHPPGDSP